MMIASEQANFDAHDWTGQLMLTSEQANFHHGFGRKWRQNLKLVRGTAIATFAKKARQVRKKGREAARVYI